MNIFVTSYDPLACAQALDDKRVIKMILESAQLLATAMYCNKVPEHCFPRTKKDNKPYLPTHINHPCTKWVRESIQNFMWLHQHLTNLLDEYKYRFGKEHFLRKFDKIIYNVYEGNYFKECEGTVFVNCTPYKDMRLIFAYRKTLIEKWKNDKRKPKWTNCEPPEWIEL